MSSVSDKAVSMATKLAAQQLVKKQNDIIDLKKTVTAQAKTLESTEQRDRALKLAAKLVVGDDVYTQIQEKAAGLMGENLDVVEKAMDLGLSQGLKLGQVMDNSTSEVASAADTNALIDFLVSHANTSEQ